MDALIAAVPLVLTLALLMLPLPAWVAPAAGVVAAVVLGITVLDADPADFTGAVATGAPTLVEVLAIIGGGITIARVMERAGAHARIARWLASGAGPGVATALLMVNGVIPFLETVTGFGVAVIVGLPLLLGLGFTPFRAAVLNLLALAVGPWGSMSPSILLGARLGDLDFQQLGVATAVLNVVPVVVASLTAVLLVHRPATARRRLWGLSVGLASGVTQAGLMFSANVLVGTAAAGALGTFFTALLWLLILRRGRLTPSPGRAVLPYVVLMAGTVVGTAAEQLLPLGAAGPFIGSPATWAFVGAGVGVALLEIAREDRRAIPGEAASLWLAVATPAGLYLVLGYALAAGGHASALATALAGLGAGYLVLAPFLAGISGYITASNTGAMSMLGPVQMSTGQALGVSTLWMNALHNSSAGYGIIAGPARLELAYRISVAAQRAGMEGPVVNRRNLLMWLVPAVLLTLSVHALLAALVLPRLSG
ncbi:MAG: L-lactate permease [Micrococcus sp.]|nr:L-lactate permease [Micrococcus sp.]